MAKVTRIHPKKRLVVQNPPKLRRHYIAEWLVERGMEPMDLLNALNDAANMDQPPIDKSQVYRWINGNRPQARFERRIAAALNLLDQETGEPDPQMLLSHPAQVWIARKLQNKPPEVVDRIRQMIDLAFPATGTDG